MGDETLKRLAEKIDRMYETGQSDAEAFRNMDDDLCMLCHAHGADKRCLFLSCLYDVKESVPEALSLADVEEWNVNGRSFYYLRICKNCRGEFLRMLREWRLGAIARRNIPKDHDGHPVLQEGTIPVRKDGRVVYMTEEEYGKYSYLTGEA